MQCYDVFIIIAIGGRDVARDAMRHHLNESPDSRESGDRAATSCQQLCVLIASQKQIRPNQVNESSRWIAKQSLITISQLPISNLDSQSVS